MSVNRALEEIDDVLAEDSARGSVQLKAGNGGRTGDEGSQG